MSMGADRNYSDADVAALYDILNPWAASDDRYLALAMAAPSVLDVGCGTGALLRRARADGHTGRLVGVDPDRAVLEVARRTPEIEWVESAAAAMTWDREFDLAVMMSHAFQFLITDGDLRASLTAIRRALLPGGRFVFETRNPAARAWEEWAAGDSIEVVDPAGRPVRVSYDVLSVDGDVVTLTETTSDSGGTALRVDQASLRFLGEHDLTTFLTEAGLVVDDQQGGWHDEPLDETSPEILTFARRR